MHNKVVSAIFTVLGFLLMAYALILVLDNNFKERCYTAPSGESWCEGGMAGAGPFALLAIASMIAAVATRPTGRQPAATDRIEPYADRSGWSSTPPSSTSASSASSYGAPSGQGSTLGHSGTGGPSVGGPSTGGPSTGGPSTGSVPHSGSHGGPSSAPPSAPGSFGRRG